MRVCACVCIDVHITFAQRAEEDDEMALLAELAAMRGSGGSHRSPAESEQEDISGGGWGVGSDVSKDRPSSTDPSDRPSSTDPSDSEASVEGKKNEGANGDSQ